MKLELNKEYKWRHAAVALLLGCTGLWFFYDGIVAWPEANREWRENPANALAVERWDKGETPLNAPENERPPHTDSKVKEQLFFGIALDGAAVAILLLLGLEALKSLEWDVEKGVMRGSLTGGRETPFSEVKEMDLRQWRSKRIARLTLENGKTVKLDAWHHANAATLVRHLRDVLKIHFED